MHIEKRVQRDVELAPFATLGIGGKAKWLVEVETLEEIKEALSFAKAIGRQFLILGKGSNTLFSDSGFDGVVIINKISFIEWLDSEVFVGAGYSFALLGVQTARKGFSGLEFASGIPGSVGGAIFMNAGASGRETADNLLEVHYVDLDGNLHVKSRDQLQFSYRHSPFHEMPVAIVAAKFGLTACETARATQLEIVKYRLETQPYDEKSAGCVFRNPMTTAGKKSAGQLIEECGLKGFSCGGASVSEKHANFLINRSGATAADFILLVQKIREKVFEQTGIELELEVRGIENDRL